MKPWMTKGGLHLRKGAGSVLCSLALVLLCVCATAATAAEKVLTIAYNAEPKTSDMQMTTDSYMIPFNAYDRLIECVTTGPAKSALVPGLATKWEVSKDGKVYTFHLRKGAKFHKRCARSVRAPAPSRAAARRARSGSPSRAASR